MRISRFIANAKIFRDAVSLVVSDGAKSEASRILAVKTSSRGVFTSIPAQLVPGKKAIVYDAAKHGIASPIRFRLGIDTSAMREGDNITITIASHVDPVRPRVDMKHVVVYSRLTISGYQEMPMLVTQEIVLHCPIVYVEFSGVDKLDVRFFVYGDVIA